VGGKDVEIAELRATATRLGIADQVILERAQPQTEIPGYLAAADALVSPRVQGINPPGKLLSYLASGRPVVATDTLVHNQLLTSECAILTRPDAAGLADGLVAALTDPVLTAGMAKGSERALAKLCCPSTRDAAYEEIASAVREAATLRHRSPARVVSTQHSSRHSSSHRH
jgi:glycosyltransferase involved in cell wall biosynthesis